MKRHHAALAALVLASISIATASAPASAAPVEITGLTYGGSGCPADSVSIKVGANGRKLILLFDKFAAMGNDESQSRKSCSISIPIKVPAGYQVSLSGSEFRGYVARRTQATLRSEYFFAGQRGSTFVRNFTGATNYAVQDRPGAVANVWSACGESVNMRVNSSMTARGQGKATVDSQTLGGGLIYNLKYRSCR
jgi:Domain of unknown function (DUF4360)